MYLSESVAHTATKQFRPETPVSVVLISDGTEFLKSISSSTRLYGLVKVSFLSAIYAPSSLFPKNTNSLYIKLFLGLIIVNVGKKSKFI